MLNQELLQECILKVTTKDKPEPATEFFKNKWYIKICLWFATLAEAAIENGHKNGIESAVGASFETGFYVGREYERGLKEAEAKTVVH